MTSHVTGVNSALLEFCTLVGSGTDTCYLVWLYSRQTKVKNVFQLDVCLSHHCSVFLLQLLHLLCSPGLDIGYVPAGPDAFFRWSGQFGPQQLIFYGPVDFYFIFLF